jgi:Uma2 family endonuclease
MSTAEIDTPSLATDTLPSIGLDCAGIRLTPEEFDAIDDYDECYRYELINGVLIVSPIPSEMEVSPNQVLGYLLLRYKDDHPDGAALDDTLPERYVRTTNRRRADRLIWARLGRCPNPATDFPAIIVEFVSSGKRNWRRDYIEKRKEYLDAGAIEYWVFNRFERRMTVFGTGAEGPTERLFEENDIYRTPLLPGFELPIARILAAADRWKGSELGES